MLKYDYINLICKELCGTTGLNFQKKVGEVLERFYKINNKTFVMPRPFGGDMKNDGYIKEENVYYQIFAPVQERREKTLKKDILEKMEKDLKGLLEILYIDKKWTQKLSKFIFLINTFDNALPEDSNNEYEKLRDKYIEKYKSEDLDFEIVVENVNYIRSILESLSKGDLEAISSYLNLSHLINPSIKDMYDMICKVSSNYINNSINSNLKNDYKRISSEEKIKINNLEKRKEKLENIISKLDVVEEAVKLFSNSLEEEEKFENTKNKIISIYLDKKNKFTGDELYDKIIEEISMSIPNGKDFEIIIEYIVVYIFDKCDIFEKE